MKFGLRLSILEFSGVIFLTTPSVAAERAFYQGKNINFVINFAAGGPTDIEGRIVARHLAKHITGQPALVPQNMAGAGGVTGMNFMGEVAKPDGLTMGYFTGPYNHQMMRTPSLASATYPSRDIDMSRIELDIKRPPLAGHRVLQRRRDHVPWALR